MTDEYEENIRQTVSDAKKKWQQSGREKGIEDFLAECRRKLPNKYCVMNMEMLEEIGRKVGQQNE